MKGARAAILVGLLLLVGVGLLAYFVSITGRKGLGRSESYVVHFKIADASGLAKRSRVVEAGIDIGKLDGVKLVNGKAVVTLRIGKDFPLYEDASVLKRPESLLSDDALLDIDSGTEGKPRIPDGGWITHIRTAPSMDQIMASVQRVANDTEKVTGSLAGAVGTPQGQQDIADILKQLNETISNVNKATAVSARQINVILANLEALSTGLRQMAPAQERQIALILENIRVITEQTKATLGMVHDVVHNEQGQVQDTVAKLDATMGSAQKIAQGVEQGQGVVGKLLRDKELADKVDSTIKAASNYIARLTGLQLELNMRAQIGIQPRGVHAKPYLPSMELIGVKLIPANSSRYIGVDLVSDSYGSVQHQVQVINNQSLVTDTYTEALTVDAYLGQHWGPSTWRVGLIESTGGVGVDLDVLPKWLSVHADAFNFTPANGVLPRLRAFAQFTFDRYFDLYAGADDILNGPAADPDPHGVLTPNGRSAFVGAGFHFTDEDLKAILSTTGVPKP